MQPKIIKTDAEHKDFLAEVEHLATEDPQPGTPKGDRLELLAKLVEAYEKARYSFNLPDGELRWEHSFVGGDTGDDSDVSGTVKAALRGRFRKNG